MDQSILNAASKYSSVVKSQTQRYNPPGRAFIPDKSGNKDTGSGFPVKLTETDPEDDKYFLRSKFVNQNTGEVPGVGIAVAPEEYFDYAKRKEDQAFYASFKAWMMKQSDLSTPEATKYWFEMCPWMRDERLAEIDREAELQKKFAKIAATGPEDQEDWLLLYLKQQDLLAASDQPLYALNTSTKNHPSYGGYTPGMFSLFNFVPKRVDNILVPTNNPINGAATLQPAQQGGGATFAFPWSSAGNSTANFAAAIQNNARRPTI